jgi:hypothetical protein
MVDFLAVQPVAGADLDLSKPSRMSSLVSASRDAAGPHGLAHQHGVEPAAAPLAAGVGAELAAALADLRPISLCSSVGNGPSPTRVV